MSYAETQTRRLATLVINKAVNKKINDGLDITEIFVIEQDNDGNATFVTFRTDKITRILAETTNLVQQNLKEVEAGNLDALELPADIEIETNREPGEEGISYNFPLGQATGIAMLGNLGPKVPVRFNAVGSVVSDIITQTEPSGINNTSIEVFIHIEVSVQIVTPFTTDITTIPTDIPVAMGFINGKVPQFYYNGDGGTAPSFEVPVN